MSIPGRQRKKNVIVIDLFCLLILAAIVYMLGIICFYVKTEIPGVDLKNYIINVGKYIVSDFSFSIITMKNIVGAIEFLKYLIPIYLVLVVIYISRVNKKQPEYKDVEHGSARWATSEELKKFKPKRKEMHNEIPIAHNISVNTKKSDLPNLNELTIGMPGMGKSYTKMNPEIMNLTGSYLITDPKGDAYRNTAYYYKRNNYKVKVLNFIKPKFSMGYNPFNYIDEEEWESEILKLTNIFFNNSSDPNNKGGDKFWDDASKALLNALTYYVYDKMPQDEKNYETIFHMLINAKSPEGEEGKLEEINPLYIIFTELEENEPDHPGVKAFKEFIQAAEETAKSIVISLAVRMNIFVARDICKLTAEDEMELDKVGEEKTVIFLIIPDKDNPFKMLTAMFYTQFFDVSYNIADYKYGGELPIMVRLLLDEFANIGRIPDFNKILSTCRSRLISPCIVIQSLNQLKGIYKDDWENIVGACAVLNYMNTQDAKTLKYISDKLGPTTVTFKTRSKSKGSRQAASYSEGEQKAQRPLLTPNEIDTMNKKNSIVFIKGEKPIFAEKYRTKKHKYSKLIGHTKFNPKYTTNIFEEFKEHDAPREEAYKLRLARRIERQNKQLEKRNAKIKETLNSNNEIEKAIEKEIEESIASQNSESTMIESFVSN